MVHANAQTIIEAWPTVTLGEQYSDNVELSRHPITDAISSVQAGGSLSLMGERRAAQLDYQTTAQLYARHSALNNYLSNHFADLHDTENFSPTTQLWLGDSFFTGKSAFGQALIGAQGVSTQLGQALLQTNFTSNSFNAHLHHDFSERGSLELTAFQYYFTSSQAGTNSTYSQGGSVIAYRRVTPRLRLGIGYDFEDYRFSDFPRSDEHNLGAYLRYAFSPALSVNGNVGPYLLDSSASKQIGVAYLLNSNYDHRRWNASLSTGRTPTAVAGFSGVSTSQYVTTSFQYRLTLLTSAYGQAYYSRYSRGGGANGADSLSYGGGLDHRFNRYISLFAQYTGYQISNPGAPGIHANSVFVGMRFTTKPFRWIW